MDVLYSIYFFFFHPSQETVAWKGYMLQGILGALVVCLFFIAAYYLWPYDRKKEVNTLRILIIVMALVFTAIGAKIAYGVPEDIAESGYQLSYLLNYVISSLILAWILFYYSSYVLRSAKKYFARSLCFIDKFR